MLFLLSLLAALQLTSSFLPTLPLTNTLTPTSPLHAIAVPNPFAPLISRLPWEKDRANGKDARKLRLEGAALYRVLGVSEDASFEEISAATKALEKEYAGDVKKKIRIGVTKDKIMDLRLKQRVGGSLNIAADARMMDMASDRADEMRKRTTKFEAPSWANGLVLPPDAKHLKQTSSYIGGAAAGCFFLPNLSTSFIMLGAMCSLGLLNNRGQPPVVRDDNGNVGEVRSTKATTILVTIALVFGNAALFAVLGSGILTAVPAIARVLPAKLVTNVMIQVGFWFAATFFQTYNTGPGKSRLQKKGWK